MPFFPKNNPGGSRCYVEWLRKALPWLALQENFWVFGSPDCRKIALHIIKNSICFYVMNFNYYETVYWKISLQNKVNLHFAHFNLFTNYWASVTLSFKIKLFITLWWVKFKTNQVFIWQKNIPFTFFCFFFFSQPFTNHKTAGEEGEYFFRFHLLDRHSDISQRFSVESSPLRIASSQTRSENLWFLSASH